jgi:hypothetical protein
MLAVGGLQVLGTGCSGGDGMRGCGDGDCLHDGALEWARRVPVEAGFDDERGTGGGLVDEGHCGVAPCVCWG